MHKVNNLIIINIRKVKKKQEYILCILIIFFPLNLHLSFNISTPTHPHPPPSNKKKVNKKFCSTDVGKGKPTVILDASTGATSGMTTEKL